MNKVYEGRCLFDWLTASERTNISPFILPSLYISICYFHPEAAPTELLLAIAGSRENVPFPAGFEVLMMEIVFELIREAGIRIPGILGSTIGIVGAIILGQAAVTARIVSPIVVVIVAVTGLASYTITEFRMASDSLIPRLSRQQYNVFRLRMDRGYITLSSFGLVQKIYKLNLREGRLNLFNLPLLNHVHG